jgi:hypothetical protein
MAWVSADTEQFPLSPERVRQLYFAEHPAIAAINLISGSLMDSIGPMLWAALILMSLWAEIFMAG